MASGKKDGKSTPKSKYHPPPLEVRIYVVSTGCFPDFGTSLAILDYSSEARDKCFQSAGNCCQILCSKKLCTKKKVGGGESVQDFGDLQIFIVYEIRLPFNGTFLKTFSIYDHITRAFLNPQERNYVTWYHRLYIVPSRPEKMAVNQLGQLTT